VDSKYHLPGGFSATGEPLPTALISVLIWENPMFLPRKVK
jgi:hypothetical protein